MLKVSDYAIVFQEIPDEITLALNISNCPHQCKNCHSPHLREDIGKVVDKSFLDNIIKINPHITCLCFMGGDSNINYLKSLCEYIKVKYNLKTAFYSGSDYLNKNLYSCLDYYKYGSYKEEFGPLDNPLTNQRLFKINKNNLQLEDITYKFWKKKM